MRRKRSAHQDVQFAIEAHELPELLGAFEELKLMLEPERRTLHRFVPLRVCHFVTGRARITGLSEVRGISAFRVPL